MIKILFQGDSITDCGRNRDEDISLGHGYATRVAGKLGFETPGEYEFLNRGIAGNKIVDLYARIKKDILNLKPDIMSILIGVNDVWSEVNDGDGVKAEKYEKIYDMLISEILEALPDIKIMILEPYVLLGEATKENWEYFSAEVKKRAAAAKRIAEKYGLVFVPLQEEFDKATGKIAEPYWTYEGVHPLAPGHELIARQWLSGFKKYEKV